jgi:hypothetical protein
LIGNAFIHAKNEEKQLIFQQDKVCGLESQGTMDLKPMDK